MRWYASLRRPGEIAHVRRKGRRASGAALSAYALGADSNPSRIAVTVSKSVGGAVARNLTKRRVKGALDALGAPGVPVRLVLIPRPGAANEPYARLAGDVAMVLERLASWP